ncbi:class I SAM-dependent methyltransferase [Candidatus Microthrix sp.]|uniref:class I SAM-dependent methyltransferase n=1 Tax=Candidatus Neomicrothrix sp. TaxID=2719034 RepID=UPI001B461054|nr:class I SAM-dependent methyltransferase [Candidatus Microthrix sp.]MBP6134894.1 methyltransferase domain-containing protein [Candidatus Microthrix sp.]MBP8957795.1 methyltransferase domain-containing protein [Candidatus Microthrix sp.]MBP9621032.1 methyltransferase domain-containing protein [Candidatus Microthrix sp.]
MAPGVDPEAAGQDEQKYTTSNPVVRRLIGRLLGRVTAEIGSTPGRLADIGTGEGLALARVVPEGVVPIGVEYRRAKVALAAVAVPGLAASVGDIGTLPFPDRSIDTVVCQEVLEHLPSVDRAVAELARITRGRCILTVPHEPFFRGGNFVRGKNLARWGNDVEHLQQFTPRRLRAVLEPHFESVEVTRVTPWLLAVAKPRR